MRFYHIQAGLVVQYGSCGYATFILETANRGAVGQFQIDHWFRPRRRSDGRGRPWRDTRAVLNGVLWILRTGAPWHDLPNRYPPYQTCHRRFQHWQRSGLLWQLLQKLAEDLRDRGKLDLSEAFVDASFSSAKKGAPPSALLDAVRAAKS
jgi:transposase